MAIHLPMEVVSTQEPKAFYLVERVRPHIVDVWLVWNEEVARSEAKRRAASWPTEIWSNGTRIFPGGEE
jgi:hypothetical protein